MGRQDLAASEIPETPEGKRSLLTELLTEDERRNWKKTPVDQKLATGKTELLRGAHYPPIAALARLGQIDKLISSFGPTLAAQVSPITGRLHPSYHTAGAKSGRATVSSPPVQQNSAGSPVPPALSSGARQRARWRGFRFDGTARGLLDRG